MSGLPDTAQCRSLLADGSVMTVTATRRPRADRADVKCSAVGASALAERMLTVVRLARHTEACFDSRDQVVISIDRLPGPQERDWELAVVLADRMVRGVYRPDGPAAQSGLSANGWSNDWQLGRVQGHDAIDAPASAPALLGGPGGLTHLGMLTGQPDAAAAVASARAWFPLHSGGINDSLCWVEVSVYPLNREGGEEEDTIAVPGLDLTLQLAVRRVLGGARHFDPRGLGRWRSVVRFGQARFHGNSFELALVMADRLARGREFLPRGRIIATGCSNAWHAGRVDPVDGCEPKCVLMSSQAVAGDRILLPAAWERENQASLAALVRAVAEKGASVACIERIGII
ncbi:MAG: hypothetical protein JWR65_2368 [Massilia sp.]|jgi:hypothetical protein|nr:hypothetical protein [Massilia sp.]